MGGPEDKRFRVDWPNKDLVVPFHFLADVSLWSNGEPKARFFEADYFHIKTEVEDEPDPAWAIKMIEVIFGKHSQPVVLNEKDWLPIIAKESRASKWQDDDYDYLVVQCAINKRMGFKSAFVSLSSIALDTSPTIDFDKDLLVNWPNRERLPKVQFCIKDERTAGKVIWKVEQEIVSAERMRKGVPWVIDWIIQDAQSKALQHEFWKTGGKIEVVGPKGVHQLLPRPSEDSEDFSEKNPAWEEMVRVFKMAQELYRQKISCTITVFVSNPTVPVARSNSPEMKVQPFNRD